MAKFVQAMLESGTTRLTAWLDRQVKIGNDVTLKNDDDPARIWRVVTVSEAKDSDQIKKDWRVGGL